MCGIFGAIIAADSELRRRHHAIACLTHLFRLSESRGKEAAGVAFATMEHLFVLKDAVPASEFIRSAQYRRLVREAVGPRARAEAPLAFIGHSRLVTDGSRDTNVNNQPVIRSGMIGVHNGIVVNHDAIWKRHPELARRFEVDSEVIFALLGEHLASGADTSLAAARVFAEIEGSASIATLFDDRDEVLLATNSGSLYYQMANDSSALVFASESHILKQLSTTRLARILSKTPVVHLEPWTGARLAISTLEFERFRFPEPNGSMHVRRSNRRRLVDRSPPSRPPPEHSTSAAMNPRLSPADLDRLFPYRPIEDRLHRCTRCILPHTMPFIRFDADGVCSYCRNYQKIEPLGLKAFERLVAPYRRSDGAADCVVGLSGGRDSTFGLYYLKKVLGLNPVSFTYDWGMVTDLARRNISRVCAKLGVENILVSADIAEKRRYIRENVEAWLARPSLGTIPLFMAGDKAYFHHLKKVSREVGAPLAILCENLLERTDFKSGFAGIPPAFHDTDHVYTMSMLNKGRLLKYYGTEFLKNPRYLNSSLADSARAFAYYYLTARDYHNLYRYVPWNEDTIRKVLLDELDFELADDTDSLWRIGDGTAAFYNYIYYTVAGFSENDTFRSNQIREGVISRAWALERILTENRPRFRTIQWYLDTIELQRPIEEILTIVHAIPKIYE